MPRLRARTVALATVLTVSGLSGCGAGGGTASQETAGSPTAGDTPPALASDTAAATRKTISVPWRLAGADKHLLELKVARAGCVSFESLEVKEDSTRVSIAALAVRTVAPGTFCSQEVSTEDVPFSLGEPLGTRKLVHARVAPDWAGPKTLGADRR